MTKSIEGSKMPFVEIIFETGNKSIAYYDTEEEMQSALAEHHRRAINGEPGSGESALRLDLAPGETRIGTWVAERVKKVLLYDEHPANYKQDQLVDSAELKKTVDDAIAANEMNGVVFAPTIAALVRDTTNPLVSEPDAQASQYKAPETGELDLAFLEAVN
jgi:hypothetical protein